MRCMCGAAMRRINWLSCRSHYPTRRCVVSRSGLIGWDARHARCCLSAAHVMVCVDARILDTVSTLDPTYDICKMWICGNICFTQSCHFRGGLASDTHQCLHRACAATCCRGTHLGTHPGYSSGYAISACSIQALLPPILPDADMLRTPTQPMSPAHIEDTMEKLVHVRYVPYLFAWHSLHSARAMNGIHDMLTSRSNNIIAVLGITNTHGIDDPAHRIHRI